MKATKNPEYDHALDPLLYIVRTDPKTLASLLERYEVLDDSSKPIKLRKALAHAALNIRERYQGPTSKDCIWPLLKLAEFSTGPEKLEYFKRSWSLAKRFSDPYAGNCADGYIECLKKAGREEDADEVLYDLLLWYLEHNPEGANTEWGALKYAEARTTPTTVYHKAPAAHRRKALLDVIANLKMAIAKDEEKERATERAEIQKQEHHISMPPGLEERFKSLKQLHPSKVVLFFHGGCGRELAWYAAGEDAKWFNERWPKHYVPNESAAFKLHDGSFLPRVRLGQRIGEPMAKLMAEGREAILLHLEWSDTFPAIEARIMQGPPSAPRKTSGPRTGTSDPDTAPPLEERKIYRPAQSQTRPALA